MSRAWYVLNTVSGYEEKVVEALKKEIEKNGLLSKTIMNLKIPMENVEVTTRSNKKLIKKKKIYPGYVLVEMSLPTDENQLKQVLGTIIRINGVVGFLGTKSYDKPPKPLSVDEVRSIFERTGELRTRAIVELSSSFEIGDSVRIISGPFKGLVGKVSEVHHDKFKLKINVEIFGRETPISIGFDQVERL